MCQDLATVRSLLEADGLVVGAIIPTDPGDDWLVLDQLPAPGGSVPVGSKVDLMLGDPLAPCPPD
jgi:beta-lactam-binding protein with PASTA domain